MNYQLKPIIVKKFTTFTTLMVGLVLMTASCTKEGPAGADGKDGQSGTVDCIKCHEGSQKIFERETQWAASGHATNGNFERNGADCAPCHTSQGFLETLETGAMVCATDIANPMPPNCYTCHSIHDSYTEDDWTLTNQDPQEFWMNGVTSDQGTANQCIRCHQGRELTPYPDLNDLTATVTITSSRYGPHHGPQGMLFAGTGGMELGTGYTNSSHTTMLDNSCIDCHMGEPFGVQAGGHQMGMTYLYHGVDAVWEGNCVSCHTDGATVHTKVEAAQDEIKVLHDSLHVILEGKGFITSSGSVVTGSYTNLEAAIIYNYKYIEEDKSWGIHNYKYSKKLLENSITAAK